MAIVVRDCINCQHSGLCFVYRGVQRATNGVRFLNINGEGAPGKTSAIFIALAMACTEWTPRKPPKEGK